MALSHSPQIVLDGLMLYLDQFNTKSYPGSGVTLYDLSGNNRHYTIFNGGTFLFDPTSGYTGNFSSTRGYAPKYRQSSGIWVDGIDDYIGGTFYSDISGSTGLTIEIGFGVRLYALNRQLISSMGNATGLDGISITTGASTVTSPIQIEMRKGSTVRTFSFSPNASGERENPMYTQSSDLNSYGFNSVSARMWGIGGTVYADISVNGSTLTSTQNATLSGITSIYPFWIFKNPTGSTSGALMFGSTDNAATFAFLRIYNRILSEYEIRSNYDAVKGRYKVI